jgi:hypothetical protein
MPPTALQCRQFAYPPPVAEQPMRRFVDAYEVLIVDHRGRLTPAQIVDQKVLALMGTCPRSLQPATPQQGAQRYADVTCSPAPSMKRLQRPQHRVFPPPPGQRVQPVALLS